MANAVNPDAFKPEPILLLLLLQDGRVEHHVCGGWRGQLFFGSGRIGANLVSILDRAYPSAATHDA